MFFISMPRSFKVGDTADCRINSEPARVTWRDSNHLVIEPSDIRPIVAMAREGELVSFSCGDAGTTHADYAGDMEDNGGGFVVYERPKPNRHERRAAASKARDRS